MVLAGLTWLGVTQFNQPPNEYAMKEAKSALAEDLKAEGQLELIEETKG